MQLNFFKLKALLVVLLLTSIQVFAQPAWTFDVFGKEKKPEKYEEKVLTSEKTATKKFGAVRRFFQNTTSHYNFFFNATTKINAIVERAKLSNKDDYTQLLSFYPYSLNNTATQKSDLDSVIYKATAGILLHDLRSEWVDNFYLLIGRAYLLRKEYDSAALTFQFINYNLYPRKKKNDDDDKIVGSNATETGTGSVSIANKENRNLAQKLLTRPPSRNEALIWQIRTFIEQNELGDAAGLISILQNDQNLPLRLQNDLSEVTAYWFYVQNNFDSAAVHLEKGLSNALTKEDKSRSQFLIAQLYENSGNYTRATDYYARVTKSTADVVMDIYARLNSAKMYRNTGDKKALQNSIDNLISMAKKDKFEAFRDIIYYSAAQLTLQLPDTTNGVALFLKSIAKNTTASTYKDKSLLQLGNIAYLQGNYKDAKFYYDSVSTIKNEANVDSNTVVARKEVLTRLVPKVISIQNEDSLQRIAALPLLERQAYVKKLSKMYSKQFGLKEEDTGGALELITFAKKPGEVENLFAASTPTNAAWYFYNTSLRAKGFNDFKTKWGKRTNTDNWRRKAAINTAVIAKNLNNNPDGANTEGDKPIGTTKETDYSYTGLMSNLPLTAALVDSSNEIIAENIYEAAQIFQNELQEYEKAIALYEDFLIRFKNHAKMPDVYLGLAFCYNKIGNTAKAAMFKNLLKTNFATTEAAKKSEKPATNDNAKNNDARVKYEAIYNSFIEGNFETALTEKRKADSVYGNTFWNPQLLYIEAVYYIKARKDSHAIATLNSLVLMHSLSPLKQKALNLISVLGRRAEIEKYLTELQVTRVAEDAPVIFVDDKPVVKVAPPAVVNIAAPKPIVPALPKRAISDSIKRPDVFVNKSFVFSPDKPHYVLMLLDKVDGVYVTEAKNALERFNKESSATASIVIKKDTLSSDKALLLFSTFDNADAAIKYFDKLKKVAPSELSWLQANKYSFLIIADDNLQLLKTNKDLIGYKELLIKNFGNKF